MLAAGLLAPVQASAVSTVNTAKLRHAVTVNKILVHERALQRIADANGGIRASGTAGFDASGAYVMKRLKKAGYSVRKQEFTFPFFRELAPAQLAEVTPTATAIATHTMDYSGSGAVTASVVPIDVTVPPAPTPSSTSGCEAADFAGVPAGSIGLIQRGTCTFEVKAQNAAAAGLAAVVVFNEGQPGRSDLLTGTLSNPQTIPVVGISYADGERLYRATQSGPVTARVVTSTDNDPNRKTFNIIADSKQGRNADETVVVGAHLDSVIAGPGINDNGSGSATILTIAEQMAKLKYGKKLQRQVRFAFWGAEENGTLGSEHYVADLNDHRLGELYANLNFDMLGSPNYIRMVYDGNGSDTPAAGPPGSGEIEKIFTDYFTGQGLATTPTAFDGRSDYGAFIGAGIPAGGLFSGAENVKTEEQAAIYGGTAGEAYDKCYHKACDDLTNLNTTALAELGDAAAHATLVLALSKKGLYPDGSGISAASKRVGVKPAETIATR